MTAEECTLAAVLTPELRSRPTPLTRMGRVLAKLESLRPTGSADDRPLWLWDALASALHAEQPLVASGTAGSALAGSAWARSRGLRLRAVVHGSLSHEVREALRRAGTSVELVQGRAEAQSRARERATLERAFLLPPLDGAAAAVEVQRSLGAELVDDLHAAGSLGPATLVVSAGARATLIGTWAALRSRWMGVRCVALMAASGDDELPELPSETDLPLGVQLVPVTRVSACSAHRRLAAQHGLQLSFASAAVLACAEALAEGTPPGPVVALVSSAGRGEESLSPVALEAAS